MKNDLTLNELYRRYGIFSIPRTVIGVFACIVAVTEGLFLDYKLILDFIVMFLVVLMILAGGYDVWKAYRK